MLLIGSRAMSLRLGSAMFRPCVDFDFVCTKAEFDSWLDKNRSKVGEAEVYELPEHNKWIVKGPGAICEFDIVQPGSSNELLASMVNDEWLDTPFGSVPPINALFAIKDAHKFKKFHLDNRNFWKTFQDWNVMKHMGCVIRDEYKAFHQLREKESYAAQKHPKLNVSKDNFFSDNGLESTMIYDHDSVHCSAAPDGIPAYTKYMRVDQPVLCDKDKFFSLPREVQLAGVVQEAVVLAIERSKVPFGDTMSDRQAWLFALSKICSSITSGWFRKFSYDHIPDVIKLYPANYWTKFQDDVENGLVRPFTESKY